MIITTLMFEHNAKTDIWIVIIIIIMKMITSNKKKLNEIKVNLMALHWCTVMEIHAISVNIFFSFLFLLSIYEYLGWF